MGLVIFGVGLGASFTAGAMLTKWLAGHSPVPLPMSAYTLAGRGPTPEGNTINVFESNVTYDDEGNFVYDYDDMVGASPALMEAFDDEGAVELG